MGERDSPEPPAQFTIKWCPVCGKNDRITALGRTKHGHRGEWCKGQPIPLTYVLDREA